MNTFLAVIIIFAVLVSIHEWGHLVFAKRAGILCREFAIGFGPKLFSFQRNETLYTVRLFPLGGFVRMAGEDPEMIQIKPGYEIGLKYDDAGKVNEIVVNNKSKHPDCEILQVEKIDLEHDLIISGYINNEQFITLDVDEKAHYIYDEKATQIAPYNRQFASKSVGKRAIAIFAGPLMNFVLAVIAFIAYAMIAGMPTEEAQVGALTDDGAAIEAGLEPGDRIVEIEGESVDDWFAMTEEIQSKPEQELEFVVERDGEIFEVSMVTQVREGPDEEEMGVIGVYPPMERNVLDAILFGFTQTYETTILIIEALGMLVTGQFSLDALAGPVGIYEYTGEVVAMGLLVLFQWTAILSVNLGIINLLPLPALDGGRLLFIGLEALRGKPVDPQKEGMVHFIGFALLMLLVLAVTWNDINRLFM